MSRTAAHRQRGVALIMAVLIVALATMLAASVSFKGYLDQRRSANAFAMDQGFEVALGGEAWAADALRRDKQQSSKTDDFTEEWATPIPPIPIDDVGGEFEGQLEDMQGRFNLNSLVMLEGGAAQVRSRLRDQPLRAAAGAAGARDRSGRRSSPTGSTRDIAAGIPRWRGRPDLHRPHAALSHREYAADARQRVAGDRRLRPRSLSQARAVRHRPAARHAHQSLHRVAGAARRARRQAGVSSRWRARTLRKPASSAVSRTSRTYESGLSADEKQELVDGKVIDQTSSYFRATIWVTIGTTQFTLYSLLYRSGNNGLVRPS